MSVYDAQDDLMGDTATIGTLTSWALFDSDSRRHRLHVLRREHLRGSNGHCRRVMWKCTDCEYRRVQVVDWRTREIHWEDVT